MSRDDPRFAEYYALLDERTRRQREGRCDYHADRPRVAWWTVSGGERCGLCESCFTSWALNAATNPSLRPVSVVTC